MGEDDVVAVRVSDIVYHGRRRCMSHLIQLGYERIIINDYMNLVMSIYK